MSYKKRANEKRQIDKIWKTIYEQNEKRRKDGNHEKEPK